MDVEALYALERALLKYRGIRYVSEKRIASPHNGSCAAYVTFEGPRTQDGVHACRIAFHPDDLRYPEMFGGWMAGEAHRCMLDGFGRQADERTDRTA